MNSLREGPELRFGGGVFGTLPKGQTPPIVFQDILSSSEAINQHRKFDFITQQPSSQSTGLPTVAASLCGRRSATAQTVYA